MYNQSPYTQTMIIWVCFSTLCPVMMSKQIVWNRLVFFSVNKYSRKNVTIEPLDNVKFFVDTMNFLLQALKV